MVTWIPPTGAATLKVNVPFEPVPPDTVEGERVTLEMLGMFRVSVADFVVDPSVAVTVPLIWVPTDKVVIVKFAEVVPASTVTLAGTVVEGDMPPPSETKIPPAGASPLRVTVPVTLFPPTRVAGDRLKLVSTGVLIVNVAVLETLFSDAVMIALTVLVTAVVVTLNVAVLCPAGTRTV